MKLLSKKPTLKEKPSVVVLILIVLLTSFGTKESRAQIGLSYFFPENGTFSIPLAPLSYSQPITFRNFRYIKFIASGTVYSIGGMSVKGLPPPVPKDKPLVGPFYSILVSFMPAVSIPIGAVDLDFCGGYFGAYNILPKVMQGNMDDILKRYESWDACTSAIKMKNNINHGWVFGLSVSIWFNKEKNAISPGLFYYMGGSKLDLKGSYSGGNVGLPVQTKEIEFENSRLNYQGFEVQIALQL
jgi:hypothetical protein